MKKSTKDWAIVAVVSIPALYVLVAAIVCGATGLARWLWSE